MIDLHTHSLCSDGFLSPTQLVNLAAERGIKLLSLTDHDTLDGLDEATKTANQNNIAFVPGIELSSSWEKGDIHIVGLGVDPTATALYNGVEQMRTHRQERTHKMIEKLIKAGVSSKIADIVHFYGRDHLGRAHFARYLEKMGACRSEEAAFKQYLGRGKPAFVSSGWLPYTEAISWITQAGGIALLAHPQHYHLTSTKLDLLLGRFVAAGGEGMEIQPLHSTPTVHKQLLHKLDSFNLMGSVGSDFHGKEHQLTSFGQPFTIPDNVRPVWLDPRIQRYTGQLELT